MTPVVFRAKPEQSDFESGACMFIQCFLWTLIQVVHRIRVVQISHTNACWFSPINIDLKNDRSEESMIDACM